MHNTYISSTVVSLRSKGSLSFSINDYSNLLNERFDTTQSSLSTSQCCSCCSCCASFPTHRVPINPSFFRGLRQSTLIQWSPCRRSLILGGGDRYFYRFPVYDLDRDCYEVSCSVKESYGGGSIGGRSKGRFRCIVSEEKRERYQLGGVDDVDAVISLLSEESSGGRERNERSYQRVEVEKRRKNGRECYWGNKKKVQVERRENYGSGNNKRVEVERRANSGSECYRGNKERVEVERRPNYGSECYRGKKKNVGSGLLERDSRCENESITIDSRGEGYRRNEVREAPLSGKTRRGRTKSSSRSSYYSFSSTENTESETEVHDNDVRFVEESSSGYKEDSRRNGGGRFEGQVMEEIRRHSNDNAGHGEVLEHKYTAAGNGIGRDCRKKSDKKLIEVSNGETQSRNETSQMRSRMVRTHESDYGKDSSSLKQLNDEEEKSTSAVNLDKGTRRQYAQIGNEPESRRNYQDITKIHDIHVGDVEMFSLSQKRFSEREKNVMVAVDLDSEKRSEYRKTFGRDAVKDDLGEKSQQLIETSEIRDAGAERISHLQRLSESRMKIREEDTNLVQPLIRGRKEQQTGETMIGQTDLRRKLERFSEKSNIHDTNIRKTSNLKFETRIRNQEEDSSLVSSSQPEVKEQHYHSDRKPLHVIQSTKGSLDASKISVSLTSDVITVTESQRTSEKRIIDQESLLTSVVKPSEETKERRNQTDERVVQTNLRKEAQKPTGLLGFHEKASSSQASLTSISQRIMQHIHVKEGDEISSQAILMPPPPQLVDTGSVLDDPSSESASQEVSCETSESSSSTLHRHPRRRIPAFASESYGRERKDGAPGEPLSFITHEDALGSAQRLQQSSMQLIGEFVEKARHEVSTSEIRKEKRTSDTKLASEVDLNAQKSSGQYGSEDSLLKRYDSRRSSGGSGAKGPSDEIWDVTNPSAQEPREADLPEGTMETGNSIVKRTGKSFWSIISDVARLRYSSRSGTPNSAARSGGKSSSNESVNSEAWFSGREPDENSDENVKRKRRNMPQETTSSYQLEVGQTSTQNPRELSDSVRPKEKLGLHEADMSSSSGILDDGSPSKGISLTSREENVGWNTDGKSFQDPRPGMDVAEFSLPLPTRSLRRSPVVKEVSQTGQLDVSGSGSMEQVEQPASARIVEESGSQGKDAELKQRKLQRNKQVLRDRFDKWEEAYKLEAEQQKIDEMFMREALLEAKKAAESWEVPVGAVLVQHGKIIARGCNLVEELRDSTAHAEMICIREASSILRSWRLADATLYVTLEPCPMCAGAILQARINTLVWGAPNKLLGADGSWIRLFPDGGGNGSELTDIPAAPVHPFHPKMTIRRGVLASECADDMQQFFQLRRKKKNADSPPSPSWLPIANRPSKILTKTHDIFHIMFCL